MTYIDEWLTAIEGDGSVIDKSENESLITLLDIFDIYLNRIEAVTGKIMHTIQVRMEADRAKAIDHPDFTVELKPSSVSYDISKLMGILELIDPKLAESSGAYTPEHEKTTTVPATWNMTKAKPLAKFNGEIGDLINQARIEGRPMLTIKKKAS